MDKPNPPIFNIEDYRLKGKQFDSPLENICFLYYLDNYVDNIDHDKLYNYDLYLQNLYSEYFDRLILEYYRPDFPPSIDVKEHVNENENNKKIKDMSKMNGGNGFIVYRKNLNKHLIKRLEIIGERISMQNLSPLAGKLWNSEPKFVKEYYKGLSEEIKKLHEERQIKSIQSEDDFNEKMSYQKIKNTKKMIN
jgi:hypothetical protein